MTAKRRTIIKLQGLPFWIIMALPWLTGVFTLGLLFVRGLAHTF